METQKYLKALAENLANCIEKTVQDFCAGKDVDHNALTAISNLLYSGYALVELQHELDRSRVGDS